jgi:tetratricopeptide (TPR) repeat protein
MLGARSDSTGWRRRMIDGTNRRCSRGRSNRWALVASLLCLTPHGAAAQWQWPERAQDLRALPADFPPERLSAVMRGFTSALGVRCSYCHVGEEGQPLESYDFVSNANPNKDRARAMYRLLGTVNDQLSEIEPSGARVNMWCHTCHNGKPRPQTLAEAVDERSASSGPDEAFRYFRELRDRYYGAGAYDFSPSNVVTLASSLQERGDQETAGRFFEANVVDHPTSWEAAAGLGDFFAATGRLEAAREQYRRALELDPAPNPQLEAKLRALGPQ